MPRNKIWGYINDQYDEAGVIPSLDDIYMAFRKQFENWWSIDLIEEVRTGFMSAHNLSGIIIKE
ncbi:hypothetical protein [Cytobacillus praedii]|uniref:hypothetical protein n=1 Tax=Cytobacillus praedii TaxID=1742358 RepID=UPI002E1FD60B|nr:hypothetical protein [Cytobacillus praedii]